MSEEPFFPNPYVTLRDTGERLSVRKILGVGRNYAKHVDEMAQRGMGARGRGGEGAEVGSTAPPVLFMKPPTAIVHDGGTVLLPAGYGELHHEVELVAVIGKPGRRIPPEQALDHVLGFAVGLDMTLRDLQAEAKERGEPWMLAKGFDTSAPVSLLARKEEVGDGSGLAITLAVNGVRRQEANTSQMVHSVAALVSWASALITLEEGDLLFTGTPEGVAAVAPGDLLEARIEKVGELRVRVAAGT
ncbi:MAG: fumarylacetoacetate hydrolase family protein [Planctomycetota bacterium]